MYLYGLACHTPRHLVDYRAMAPEAKSQPSPSQEGSYNREPSPSQEGRYHRDCRCRKADEWTHGEWIHGKWIHGEWTHGEWTHGEWNAEWPKDWEGDVIMMNEYGEWLW